MRTDAMKKGNLMQWTSLWLICLGSAWSTAKGQQSYGPNAGGMVYPMSQFASGQINGGRLRDFRPLGEGGLPTFTVGMGGYTPYAHLMTGADFPTGVDGSVETGYRLYMDGWEAPGAYRQSGR
ncbi:MAG: hypothetical protein KC931_23620, partial [Candidatus Omnitrophica bacterium]|nr:hypothetical protein [Candidatus Omnitrophota bacterium]